MKQIVYLDLNTLKAEKFNLTIDDVKTAVHARDFAAAIGMLPSDIKPTDAVVLDVENKQTFHTDIDAESLRMTEAAKNEYETKRRAAEDREEAPADETPDEDKPDDGESEENAKRAAASLLAAITLAAILAD